MSMTISEEIEDDAPDQNMPDSDVPVGDTECSVASPARAVRPAQKHAVPIDSHVHSPTAVDEKRSAQTLPVTCKWFLKGTCKFGCDCRYQHLDQSGLPEHRLKPPPIEGQYDFESGGSVASHAGCEPRWDREAGSCVGRKLSNRESVEALIFAPRLAQGVRLRSPPPSQAAFPAQASAQTSRNSDASARISDARRRGPSANRSERPRHGIQAGEVEDFDGKRARHRSERAMAICQVIWCDQRAFKDDSAPLREELEAATRILTVKAHKTAEKCIRLLRKKQHSWESSPVAPLSVFLVSWANAHDLVDYLATASHILARVIVLCDTCGLRVRHSAERWAGQYPLVEKVAGTWAEAVGAAAVVADEILSRSVPPIRISAFVT